MLQGAWGVPDRGLRAVGISVAIGIFMGGLAGFYGQRHIALSSLLVTAVMLRGRACWQPAPAVLGSRIAHNRSRLALLVDLALGLQHRQSAAPRAWVCSGRTRSWWIRSSCRFVDIMLCFPSFFLILTVVALLPASIYNIMIVIGLTSWEGTRVLCGRSFLSLREQDFVAAAKALGVSNFRIIFRHMVPNAIAPVLVSATIGIASAILTEAGLSFLRFRRAAAPRHVGEHSFRWQTLHLRRPLADLHSRGGHLDRGAVVQPVRGGAERYFQPEAGGKEIA